ncbi:uncharacterized protein K02A2.6-like [Armigeres subalbatus]|uniref:uncharacterized protein K02A2.6-like n=1 Tax=Armigeres subalbatus TaxID=124917 RepID=UPI002ED07096
MDTGSPITIISETFYRNNFGEFTLHPFRGKLVFYTGGEATLKGAFEAVLCYQGRQAVGQIVVIEGGRNPLIGRDFIGELLHLRLNKLDTESSDSQEVQLKTILNEYQELFDGFLAKVVEELDALEKTGIVTKAAITEGGTQLVTVLKKDNIRLCADYRVTVNPFLEDKRYPMPVVEDLFDTLQGGKLFSKLDLKSAYNQLELEEESRKMLGWSTHKGIYYVNRLPFVTQPACAIFQEVLEKLLQECPGCINFLDDVLVTSATVSEHLKNLARVLSKLLEAGFRLNREKYMEALAVYYAVRRLSSYLLGKSFTILTDHQPLVSLFGRKGIPDMVFGKLQHWAVFLANYGYEIKYIKGVSNKVADFLSRSPVQCCDDEVEDDEEVMFLQYIESETRSLVERKQLIIESRRDPVVSRVVHYVKTGWPAKVDDPELKKYFVRKDELVVEEGVLMWGYRIIAPMKLRSFLLQELHSTHLGIVKMKSLARNYFWWPSIDKEIEAMGKRLRRSHQILKYDYDDYEEKEVARGEIVCEAVPIPDEEYLSAEDDDTLQVQQDQLQPDQPQRGHYRADGVYVTRSSRMVRVPSRN